ncbi:MAG: heparinase II/III domain-containing protein [Armatimonadota bacterium]
MPACRAAQITFSPHPRLLYTAVELTAWKGAAARQEELRRVVTRADGLLKRGLQAPEKEGQWVFYYSCPKDGSFLNTTTLEKHVCPVCKAVYTDERTIAAYRTVLQGRLEAECIDLSLAYALTGEEKFAEPVRAALLTLARVYPTLRRHDRWGRTGLLAVTGGRRYAQLLDEATGAIKLSRAYDLIANATCLSMEDHKSIEGMLGNIAREIRRQQLFAGLRNNHQTWFNAAYANVGVAIGDEWLVKESLDGSAGLRWQLEHSVTSDGLWYEGAMAYHFYAVQVYAVQAIIDTLDALKRVGFDLSDNVRLKSLWQGPQRLAYPNGQFPVMHDSDPGNLRNHQAAYTWAAAYFNERLFTGIADGTSVPLGSANLSGIGVVALRRGQGKDALCAMMDYGIHGDHHGHPDKLNIVLFGMEQELLLDPGRISYTVPEYETWCRTTVAHNTVAVNGRNQQPDTGRLLYFKETSSFAAALGASDQAYPGVALRRFLVLIDAVLVDVLTVCGTDPMQLDWFAHGRGMLTAPFPLIERKPLGTTQGYQHLAQLREAPGVAQAVFTLSLDEKRSYRVWCLGDETTSFVTGTGLGYRLTDHPAFLLRRRQATSSAYVTLYDLSGDGSGITEAMLLPVRLDGEPVSLLDGIGLRITGARGMQQIALDLRDDPKKPLTLGGITLDRCLVVGQAK